MVFIVDHFLFVLFSLFFFFAEITFTNTSVIKNQAKHLLSILITYSILVIEMERLDYILEFKSNKRKNEKKNKQTKPY